MLNIAHRGGAGLRPENTLAAFAHALMMGADGAELDVQLTRDGEVVVFHDYLLNPELCRDAQGRWLTKPTPRIKDLTLAALQKYDVGRPDPGSKYAEQHPLLEARDGETIPSLDDVVALAKTARKPFRLFVELKTSFSNREMSAEPGALAEATIRILRSHDYLDRSVLVGFDWEGLLHAKKIAPKLECWFTTLAQSWFGEAQPPPEDDPPAAPALAMLRSWAQSGSSPWAAGYDAVKYGGSILRAIRAAGGDGWFPMFRDATPERVAEARALGLKVGAWTVNRPADMKRLAGLDAICTDRPDLLPDAVK
jgi:glycerophosphoryl diester phosphodiesterase